MMTQQSNTTPDCGCKKVTADAMDISDARRHFDMDATSWLVGEAIRHMNAADDKQELAYRRTTELLAQSSEATKTIAQILYRAPRDDINLRWALLYLLADIGDAHSAPVFAEAAVEAIEPRERDRRACETPRDGEVLVRTMAIEGLARVATTHKLGTDLLYRIIEAQPEPALRIEAVKAILAMSPNEAEKLKKILPEQLHFALSLQRVKAETLAVEFDSKATDMVKQMPQLGAVKTTPAVTCCHCG
jgi:hypothetical protein